MKRFACILICAAAVAGVDRARAAAGTDAKKAPAKTTTFVPRLVKGDRFVLEVTKGRTQTGRPQMAKVRGLQVIDVEILAADGKKILLGWTSRKTSIIDPDGKTVVMPAQATALTTLFDGVQMVFELSPDCEMVGLKNLDQIRPIMTKIMDKTLAIMDRSAEDKAKLRQTLAAMLNSRETIEMICSRQITLLLASARIEIEGKLEKGSGGERECQFPMPYGGGAIPATIATEVTKLDLKAKEATITMNTRIDPRKAAKAMYATMKAMARKTGNPVPPEKDMPKVDIQDVRTYVIDLKTNLPLSAQHKRATAMGPNKRTDTITIVRKPAKATSRPAETQR